MYSLVNVSLLPRLTLSLLTPSSSPSLVPPPALLFYFSVLSAAFSDMIFSLGWFQTSLSTFIIKIFKTVSYFCCILNLRSELSLWLVSAPFSTTLTYCSTEVPIAAHHTEGRTKFDVFYTVSPDKERSSSKVWYDNLLTYYFIRALLYENTSLGWAAVQIRERKSWGKRDCVCVLLEQWKLYSLIISTAVITTESRKKTFLSHHLQTTSELKNFGLSLSLSFFLATKNMNFFILHFIFFFRKKKCTTATFFGRSGSLRKPDHRGLPPTMTRRKWMGERNKREGEKVLKNTDTTSANNTTTLESQTHTHWFHYQSHWQLVSLGPFQGLHSIINWNNNCHSTSRAPVKIWLGNVTFYLHYHQKGPCQKTGRGCQC